MYVYRKIKTVEANVNNLKRRNLSYIEITRSDIISCLLKEKEMLYVNVIEYPRVILILNPQDVRWLFFY